MSRDTDFKNYDLDQFFFPVWVFWSDDRDFSGGSVVKNPPANAGDMGLSLGPGRSHMLRSN